MRHVGILRPKLLMLLAEDWFFLSHFKDRAAAAAAQGFDVIVAAHSNGNESKITAQGFRFANIPFQRRGLNPLGELQTLLAIRRVYRTERPNIVHHVGLKPILYGTLAARGPAIVNAPVGMGFVFTSNALLARILRRPVRILLRWLLNPRKSKVIFENGDDLRDFVADGTVRTEDTVLIRGAGVDVTGTLVRPEPSGPISVLFAARMLRDKGVMEFVAAARRLRTEGRDMRFLLIGEADPQNPASLSHSELVSIAQEGTVEWLGFRTDVPDLLAKSHIAVLPSYREGLPKFLLEAMAAGRPVVATNVPGCREAVVDGVTGVLVPARDSESLANALAKLADDTDLRAAMGSAGRKKAEDEFSTEQVAAETLAVYMSYNQGPEGIGCGNEGPN